MCCFITSLFFFGPRLAFLVYWVLFPARVDAAFGTFIWPFLGLIFLPLTLLMYVIVFPVVGFDWVWIGLAFLADISGYVAGARQRQQVPGYSGP